MKRIFCTLACVSLLALTPVWGFSPTPTLDDIVNCFKLDQRAPGIDRSNFSTITPEEPVGQTFITGPDTVALARIGVAVAHWNEEWQQGESLVMTVYDSPARNTRIGSFAIPWEWRMWEGQVLMFPFYNVPIEPNSEYYFELTVEGGNGTITGIFHAAGNYQHGTRHLAGKPVDNDIWFETHVKTDWDRDADYTYYFSQWNLDYPGLEKVREAVSIKDWDRATRELVAYYESRDDLVDPVTPVNDPNFDRSYAELVAQQKIKDEQGQVWDLKPDWNHYIQWPLRGGVGLTRTGIRSPLAGAYRNTGDEFFAEAFNDMILKTLRDQPSPLRAGYFKEGDENVIAATPAGIAGGSMWSALSIGARMNNMWYFYQSVMLSEGFTHDARTAMIFNMVDMANVLSMMKGGGNWETQIGDALLEFGQRHPELKLSQEWFAEGFERLMENSAETVHPDGSLWEASINYHGLVTNRFLRLLENARINDFDVPRSFERRVERMLEFILYNTGPNWLIPATGDTFGPWSGASLLSRGAEYFDRKDFLWGATHGRQGHRPAATSAQFPHSGWFIMRSGWDRDARFMHIHNGPNRGHGHHDALQVVVNAYGSELLIDPGIYVYGTPEAQALTRSPLHSTITVDGRDTVLDGGPTVWVSNPKYDYFDGTNAGYHGLDGVKMRRQVVFVKPDYWVVVDEIQGTGNRQIDSRFVCAEGTATVRGNTASFTDGRNGLLVVSPAGELENVTKHITEGIRPVGGGRLADIPIITKTVSDNLPIRMVQALVPYRGTNAPRVEIEVLESTPEITEVVVRFRDTGKQDQIRIGPGKSVVIK